MLSPRFFPGRAVSTGEKGLGGSRLPWLCSPLCFISPWCVKEEGAAKGPALVYVFYSCVPVSAAISLQLPKPCATVLVQAFPLAAVLLEENWDTGEAGERKALKWLRCSSL